MFYRAVVLLYVLVFRCLARSVGRFDVKEYDRTVVPDRRQVIVGAAQVAGHARMVREPFRFCVVACTDCGLDSTGAAPWQFARFELVHRWVGDDVFREGGDQRGPLLFRRCNVYPIFFPVKWWGDFGGGDVSGLGPFRVAK